MTRHLAICAAAAQRHLQLQLRPRYSLDVVAAMERATGRPLPVRDAPRRPGDPPAIVAGAERARQVLGWSPRHDDLDLIVASALAWERRLRQRNA
jgi:UDP-glucose 4-epimerase